jgi:Zn-dependent peptidase ImmA (M78 family)|uniref:ImmA/IrrE family metallo-endopeptidase n=1 Tax=Dictyoglomus turgidum TaxID=513050 RepID=A0A7C3SNF6_9BACT
MYEDLTKEILAYFFIKKPPVKPDVIAYGLGFNITFTKVPTPKISGIIYNKEIVINSSDPIVRQRFSLAHELGHYFLHDQSSSFHKFDKEYIRKEQEADLFAASLLMPLFMLENYLYLPVEEIAKIFIVSRKAVELRLKVITS